MDKIRTALIIIFIGIAVFCAVGEREHSGYNNTLEVIR